MPDIKAPEAAHTEWMLGWAAGYHAALRGEPSPWRNVDTDYPERQVREGQHWKQGYKEGHDRARDQKQRGVKVSISDEVLR
jgi:hypothetical protein